MSKKQSKKADYYGSHPIIKPIKPIYIKENKLKKITHRKKKKSAFYKLLKKLTDLYI